MMDLNKIQHATVDTSKEPIEFGDGRVASNLADLKLDVEKNKIVMFPEQYGHDTGRTELLVWRVCLRRTCRADYSFTAPAR